MRPVRAYPPSRTARPVSTWGGAQRVEMVVMRDKPITQRANERARVVIVGHRTDDGDLCSLVVVHERTGGWRLYPHGDNKLGVRLAQAEAAKMARAILDGER